MSTLQDAGPISRVATKLAGPIAAEPPNSASHAGVSVTARDVGKRFGAKRVLNNLSLSIAPGEFVAIVGRSGCGKSTFLRLLAALDDDFDGEIRFGEERRTRHADAVRVMFQEPRLLPWATVLDNVAVGLGETGTQHQRRAASARALEAVGLGDRAHEWPTVLSGGQRQRVALARALVSGPAVLALDEPLGALDALTRIEMQALIGGSWLERSFTALMVTHDVGEAVALADRVVVIEDGRVTLDVPIDIPRPRRRGDPLFAALEEQLLARLLQR